MQDLSRAEKLALLELLEEQEKRLYEKSYYEFFKAAWHVLEPSIELVDQPYIKFLCDRLQYHVEKIINGEEIEIDVLLINIPPSSSKSSIVTKFLNPWIWINAPWFKVMNSSYNATLSRTHCVKSRDIINSPWYKERWGNVFHIKADENQKSQFQNNKTGLRMATSTGGSATGFHFNLFIQDDPLNPQQAASKTKLENSILFNDKTVPSRILPNGLHIIVMQRLHYLDPTGHELKKTGKRIEHICLPAELSKNVKPEKAKELYQNDLLDPVRLSKDKLTTLEVDLGAYGYSGQYKQNPSPEGGGKVKSSWFQYCDEKEVPGFGIVWDMWVDGAYTKNTANDPSGIVICGFHEKTNRLYVLYAHSAFLEMPEMLKLIPEFAQLYNLRQKSRIRFEPKATGKSFKQMINASTKYSAVEIKTPLVNEGKESRIQTASPKIEAGKIWLVKGSWNESFTHQITAFPNAEHDEYVDLIGYACEHYFKQKPKAGVRLVK